VRGAVGAAGIVAVALMVLASACDREDLVVATVGEAGTSDVDAGTPCHDDDECVGASNLICEKMGCGDNVVGTCKVATTCDDDGAFKPVCGCDNVTYWNDCERQNALVPARGPAGVPCGEGALLCESKDDCRNRGLPGTFCALALSPDRTCNAVKGTCWTIPVGCTGESGPQYFHPCSAAQGVCESFCQAILGAEAGMNDENECQK
jgi:hypothetical protein